MRGRASDMVMIGGLKDPEPAAMSANQNEALRFLLHLDPAATFFTFQTFDDNEERAAAFKAKHKHADWKITRVLHGSLDQHAAALNALNAQGAGVFVTVNETDGKGRKEGNIVRIRAAFADLDGAPLEPVLANGMQPHIVTETSPGRWHAYWRVCDLPLERVPTPARGHAPAWPAALTAGCRR
jgi:putative DNA primase/helicase